MHILLIFFLIFALPVQAETLSLEDFSKLIGHLQIQDAGEIEEAFALPQKTVDLCQRLAEVTEIKTANNQYMVNLFWINEVLEAISSENTVSRRRLLYANLADTLQTLVKEIAENAQISTFDRQQMLEALDRAMGKTSEIKLSPGTMQSQEASWCSGGAYVIDEPGEAISIVHATSGNSSKVFASSGNFGGFSGGSGGSGGSSSSGSFNAAGSSGGTINNSGSSSGSNSSSGSSSSSSSSGSSGSSQQNYQQNKSVTHQASKPAQNFTYGQKKQQTLQRNPTYQPKPKPQAPPPPPPKKTPGSANFFFWVILVISLIGFAILIYFIVRNLHRNVKAEQSHLLISEKDLPPERLQTQTIYEKALQAAAQENFAEAIRLLTVGALLLLEEHRVLNFQDTMTNGEYLRKLMNQRQLHTLFASPMALFDKLIYGFQSPDKKDFELFKEFYLNLEKQEK